MQEGNREAASYRIRISKNDWSIEVSAPEREFVVQEIDRLVETLTKYNEETWNTEEGKRQELPGKDSTNAKPQTLVEFFRQFKFETNLQKILVLGYWWEMKESNQGFNDTDIAAKFKEVREPAPGNISRDLVRINGKGWITRGKNTEGELIYEMTHTGIVEVETKMLKV